MSYAMNSVMRNLAKLNAFIGLEIEAITWWAHGHVIFSGDHYLSRSVAATAGDDECRLRRLTHFPALPYNRGFCLHPGLLHGA
jgi:hypothetical protein